MNEQCTCLNCNSSNLEKGTIRSTGKMNFRPDDAKFLKLKTANVGLDAYLCLDCGTVFLKADTQKVRELTERRVVTQVHENVTAQAGGTG